MKALAYKLAFGTAACLMTGLAMAGNSLLPIEEGGILAVAIVGLLAGIRIIQRKNKR